MLPASAPPDNRARIVARLTQRTPRAQAWQAVLGEPGLGGLVLLLLAAGTGLLFDFWVLGTHPIFSIGLTLIGVPASQYWTITRALRQMNPKFTPDYVRNLALATVAGQAGCGTLVVVFMALFGGMFLDAQLNTHPIFTIGLVLVAIPVSLYGMVQLTLSAVAAIKTDTQQRGSRTGAATGRDQSTTKENGA